MGGFFIDNAENSSVICGLWFTSVICGSHTFRKKKFFEVLTLSPTLSFGLLYFVRGLMYRFERKSVFLTSLSDFPIDQLSRATVHCGLKLR